MAELEDKEVSRRALLESAWDEAESDDKDDGSTTGSSGAAGEEGAAQEGQGAERQAPEGEQPEGEGLQEKPKAAKSDRKRPDPDKQERKAAAAEGRADDKQQQSSGTEQVTDRAPQSWKPAVREHWPKLPKEVRDTISTREKQIQVEMTQMGNIKKFAQNFAQVIEPYQHIIRAQNSTPLRAVQNLMATSATLYQGSAQQKAEAVAAIIGNFSIDLQTLDSVLVAMQKNGGIRPQQGTQRVEAPPQWAKPIFDFMQTAEQSRQQYTERMQQEANGEVEKFSDRPYFDDLREEMADLMEVAASRGKVMTLEQAYQRAVALNPDVQKIISQRQAAERARQQPASAVRRAASTIKGAPNAGQAAGGSQGKPASRRAALSEAWDDLAS